MRAPQAPGARVPVKGTGNEFQVGQLFAERYRIDKQVGKGGMGAVYLATQEPLSRSVAIKVLHGTADEVTVGRFQREARLIAQLQHPHIVGLIDFGEDNGRLYLVMEYIDGEPLSTVLEREAPFEPRRVVDVALQIAEALAVAHDMSVVHRDVKPDNIMVLRTAGGQDFIKMLDFGVAKIKRDGPSNNNTVETKAGLIVGSLRYISPEQVENGEITTRTDIYSYGCVLYEMLAGRRVFDYPSPADCAIAHITEPPQPPEVRGQTLRGPLVDFIMRCLEKKAPGRPANAREAIQALQACRDQPIINYPGPNSPTLLHSSGGPDAAQVASAMAASQGSTMGHGPRPIVNNPAMSKASSVESRRLDSQIRTPRPSGVHSFEIVGGDGSNTSTNLHGVRLMPRTTDVGAPAAKSRWWLWLLVALAAIGTGVVIVLLVAKPGADAAPKPAVPVEAGADVAAEVSDPADAAVSPAAADVASAEAAAETSSGEVGPDVASDASGGDVAVVPAAIDKTSGAMVRTEPTGAMVLRDKQKLCTTPCLVSWAPEESPPIVRISLKGYIDIDLQFVKADRGTDQHLELRKQP